MSEGKNYPLGHSLRGDNLTYVGCDQIGRRANYAICCNTLKAYEEGRRAPEDDCSREIKNGLCEAARMRQKEVDAGHTLFYKPRPKVVATAKQSTPTYVTPRHVTSTDAYKRGYERAGDIISGKRQKVKGKSEFKSVSMPVNASKSKPKPAIEHDVSDFGAAINMAMLETVKPTVKPTPVEAPPLKKESVLERAKRVRAENIGKV